MLWENLKKKLPIEMEYTEMGETSEGIIEAMKITDTLIHFTLKTKKKFGFFNVSCSRDWLSISSKENRLLIEAKHLWTMLLKNPEVKPNSSQE